MNTPDGLTEAEVLDGIEKAVMILAPSFVFGYFDLEDIRQEARLFGFKCLDKWDGKRPWPNFVYSHIRNRLINLRRNKLRRNDPPCRRCHSGDLCSDGYYCKKYHAWLSRNSTKANIMQPFDLNHILDSTKLESTVFEDVEIGELCRLVDEKLPVDFSAPIIQIRAGVKLPKTKRIEVETAVRKILGEERGPCHPNQDD